MGKYSDIDVEALNRENEETERIENKMLDKKTQQITPEEVAFIKERAESGSPNCEFVYGLYILLYEDDLKEAEVWWNKFYEVSNGYCLMNAVKVFAYLGDDYYDWAMKCLEKAASRKYKPAEVLLKLAKANPRKWPEA